VLADEVKQFIGKPAGSSIFEVEKEPIRRFADSVGDENPLYWDEEYAKKSRYGSIIAPPGFISSPWYAGRAVKWGKKEPMPAELSGRGELMGVLFKAGYWRVLDGGIEYEFFEPVKADDTIKAASIIKDVIEREGKTGKMAFLITETTYTNQKGQVVAKARQTSIHR
jgi:acyl dehydratase